MGLNDSLLCRGKTVLSLANDNELERVAPQVDNWPPCKEANELAPAGGWHRVLETIN